MYISRAKQNSVFQILCPPRALIRRRFASSICATDFFAEERVTTWFYSTDSDSRDQSLLCELRFHMSRCWRDITRLIIGSSRRIWRFRVSRWATGFLKNDDESSDWRSWRQVHIVPSGIHCLSCLLSENICCNRMCCTVSCRLLHSEVWSWYWKEIRTELLSLTSSVLKRDSARADCNLKKKLTRTSISKFKRSLCFVVQLSVRGRILLE